MDKIVLFISKKKSLMKKNTIKQYALFTLLCLSFECVIAQEIEVKDICQLTTDISARSEARVSPEGKDCAMVRVNLPTIKTMDFKNNTVGDVKYKAGEYMVYIPEGTKQIPFSVEGYNGGIIDFEKFNISVEGKCVYRVSLYIQKGNNSIGQAGSLKITTQPESSFILLDGIPVGESPLAMENVSVGTHTIAFPNTSGYSLPDQTITIHEGETCEKHFDLVETEVDDFDIPMRGSDNDGTGWWPVKYKEIKQKGKHGLTDYWDKILVPCEFSSVNPEPVDGYFRVSQYGMGQGVYKPQKGLVIPCIYDWFMWNNGNPFIQVEKDGKWGIVRLADGKEMLPCVYEYVYYIADGIYKIEQKEGYKLLNMNKGVYTGEWMSWMSDFYHFNEGIGFAADKEQHLYLIDTLCNVRPLPEKYYRGEFYTEGIMCVRNRVTDKLGVINENGEELTPFIYDEWEGGPVSGHGMISLYDRRESKKFMVVDKNGHCYTSDKEPYLLSDKYINYYKEGKAGLVDFNGDIVLPFEFEEISNWDDMIMAKKDRTIFLYDSSLKVITSFPFEEEQMHLEAKNGIVLITDIDNKRYGYMNYNGEILTGCFYDTESLDEVYVNLPYELLFDGLALLCIGDRCGLIDKNGEVVVPLIYSIILPFSDGTVYARKRDGTWVELNMKEYRKS